MIALAIILGIIVAIIGVILFAPVTYSFFVDSRKPYSGEVRLRWLRNILSVHIAYEGGKPLFKEVYVLGKLKVGAARDYEDWLNRRVQEETDSMNEPFESSLEDEIHHDGVNKEYVSDTELDRNDTNKVESVKFNAKGEVINSSKDTNHEGKTNEIVHSEDKSTSRGGEDRKDSAQENLQNATEKDAPSETIGELEQKLVELDKFWWWKHVTNGNLYVDLFTCMRQCYDHSKLRDFQMEGRFGLPNPYMMGLVSATLHSLWYEKMSKVELDYTSLQYEGRISNRGRTMLGVLAWYGTVLVLKKPMRSFLVDAVKFGWQWQKNRKVKKALKELQSEL